MANDVTCSIEHTGVMYIATIATFVCSALVCLALTIHFLNKEEPTSSEKRAGILLLIGSCALFVLLFMVVIWQGGSGKSTEAMASCKGMYRLVFYTIFLTGVIGAIALCVTFGSIYSRDRHESKQAVGRAMFAVALALLASLMVVTALQSAAV